MNHKARPTQTKRRLDPGQPTRAKKISWLRDHWSQVLVLCVSLLTAACYLVGRAKLLGWYDAAGIPHLMFAWSAQDVVIHGLLERETWLLLLVVIGGGALVSAFMDIATADMRRVHLEFVRLRMRGENCDRLGLRKRMAYEARRVRLAKDERAAQATLHWRMLETRGTFRKAIKKDARKSTRGIPSDAYKMLMSMVVLVLLMMLLLLVNFFYAWSHRTGAKSYWAQYVAATGSWPPSRGAGGWMPKDSHRPVFEELSTEGKALLRDYAYVQVKHLGEPPKRLDSPMCGWMVQAAGNVLVLLNSSGLLVLNFADSPFQWSTVSPDACGAKMVGQTDRPSVGQSLGGKSVE